MHSIHERKKLVSRVRRIRGQVEAVERALDEERGCYEVLQTVAAARGAIDALVVELMTDHVREHVLGPRVKAADRARAGEELIEILRSYIR